MTEPAPVNLIDLQDVEGNRCLVRVTGRYQPGVLTGHDTLRADVLVSASFVDARLELYLFQQDLDTWQHDLTQLAPGKGATIGGDRGLTLDLFIHEDRTLSLTIQDPHQRLDHVRKTWPSEIVETGPGTYEWSPSRKR